MSEDDQVAILRRARVARRHAALVRANARTARARTALVGVYTRLVVKDAGKVARRYRDAVRARPAA